MPMVTQGQLLDGRYRLLDVLGQGGMSVVWRAHDEVLGRDVALKVLAAAVVVGAAGDCVRAEARAVAKLSHPRVAGVFDYGEVIDESGDRVPFIVMELLRGTPLSAVSARGPIPVSAAVRICAQVAEGLAAAHAEGIVHRDIKPGNVMLTPVGAKVFDFGIAAAAGVIDGDGPNETVVGTIAYIAPERLAGAPVLAASDVYALGLMLYRLIAYADPWPAVTPTDLIEAHLWDRPADLAVVPGVTPELSGLYTRCGAKDPADRPTARELAHNLARTSVVHDPRPGAEVSAWSADGGPYTMDLPATQATSPMPGDEAVDADDLIPFSDTATYPPDTPRPRRFLLASLTAVSVAIVAIVLAGWADIIRRPTLPAPVAGAVPSASQSPASQDTVVGAAAPSPASNTSPPGPVPSTLPPSGTPSTSSPPPGSQPGPATFVSVGGTIAAICRGAESELTAWSPALGYDVKEAQAGPAVWVSVVFHRKRTDVSMAVTCTNGVPAATVTSKS